MKIQYASDIHLELSDNLRFIKVSHLRLLVMLLAYGDSWRRKILPNVHYYQNKVVRIDNVDFILSTLWSHIRPEDEYFVHRGMNDFRQILYNGRRFTPADFNAEHEKCLDFIKQSVTESTAKRIVVITHHLPSMAVG